MPSIVLFCEDSALETVIGSLVERMAEEQDAKVQVVKRSVGGGHGAVVGEFRQFTKDMRELSSSAYSRKLLG